MKKDMVREDLDMMNTSIMLGKVIMTLLITKQERFMISNLERRVGLKDNSKSTKKLFLDMMLK